nr:hypothetical protein [Tanacetum cinerariifolium]
MRDENPICTLRDYSKPSHEGYKNTIELPIGNNVDHGLRHQGWLRKISAEKAWATIEELARYEEEGWNDLVAPREGSDYENSDIKELLGVMECKVDTLKKEAISLIGRSKSVFGMTSNTVYQLPSEPSRQEEFKDLVMNFILSQEEKVRKLEEYMCVIGSDFIQLSLVVIRKLREEIRIEQNITKKIKKITSDEFVDIPSKETVKVGLATVGLINKDHPSLSTSDLINLSSVIVKYFSPTWKSLIPPFGEVNADDTTNKSLSRTSMPPVTQPKAKTAKRPRKKKIPSSTQPEVLKSSRISKSSSLQATYLQPAEEFVVIADATKSLDASESAEVLDQNIMEEEDDGVYSLEEPTFEQLMDEVDKLKEGSQRSTLDDINVINITPKDDKEGDASDFDLCSMPSDDLASLTGFETSDSDNEASISVTKKHSADNLMATSDGDVVLPNASAGVSALSDPFGHLQRELTTISSKVDQLESKITKRVFDELKSSIPSLVSDALKETLPSLLIDALKAYLLNNSDCVSDLKYAIKDMNFLIEAAEVFKKVNAEGENSLSNCLPQLHPALHHHPRDPSKGKGIATKEPMKELIPYIKEGGSDLIKLNIKPFVTTEGELSQEEYMAQIKEMKRLADLKAVKAESKKSLRKIMNPATVQAQTLKLAEYEEKKAKEA